jgi:hypothetical protein
VNGEEDLGGKDEEAEEVHWVSNPRG